jgi:2,3-diketo-5-methylthio-1-phosphopentane phosphatase
MPDGAMALANTTVFLDFDGTISTVDVTEHLLERLGAPEWCELHADFTRGAITSRERLYDAWDMIATDEATLRSVAAEVPLDPSFDALVGDLRAAGAEVVIVADDFGFYVEPVAGARGLEVLTNEIDFATGRLQLPHASRCCPCSSCGVCKQAPIKDAQYVGRTAVLVGSRVSDRKASLLADVVFAKDELAEWCVAFGVEFTPFRTLADVRAALIGAEVGR